MLLKSRGDSTPSGVFQQRESSVTGNNIRTTTVTITDEVTALAKAFELGQASIPVRP